jgi:hypothetical protein
VYSHSLYRSLASCTAVLPASGCLLSSVRARDTVLGPGSLGPVFKSHSAFPSVAPVLSDSQVAYPLGNLLPPLPFSALTLHAQAPSALPLTALHLCLSGALGRRLPPVHAISCGWHEAPGLKGRCRWIARLVTLKLQSFLAGT